MIKDIRHQESDEEGGAFALSGDDKQISFHIRNLVRLRGSNQVRTQPNLNTGSGSGSGK